MTIPPLASRTASYRVNQDQLNGSTGPYTATIEIIAGMVPANLIHAIKDVGFDYGLSPREVADAIVEGHQILWSKTLTLETGGNKQMASLTGGE
jgi:hypothetical protein